MDSLGVGYPLERIKTRRVVHLALRGNEYLISLCGRSLSYAYKASTDRPRVTCHGCQGEARKAKIKL